MSVSTSSSRTTPTTETATSSDCNPKACKADTQSPPKRRRMESRPSHSTSIQFDISNKTALSDLSKRFNPPPLPTEPTPPPKRSSYFEKLDVTTRLELDHGVQHIIDVQPDLRFPLQYFMYNTAEEYPDLTTKSHPYVSTFTLIAYQQLMLNACLLICDIYSRESVSYFAQGYKSDSLKSDYLSRLMSCYIPSDLEVLINNLAPTYDPQRRLQLYVPSLDGFDFLSDFGRSVPPQMFILAHHLLASTRSNADPETILRTYYSTIILEVGTETFTSSNFLGGYFDRLQRPTNHTNWLNARFEKIFNPVIGRALIQRPTLAKTRLQPQQFQNFETVNPYDFLLCYSENNLEKILEVITDVSSFIKAVSQATKMLSQTLTNSTGVNIMYHSLWSATLPTCYMLPPPTILSQLDTDELNDTAYARYVKYLQPAPVFKSKLQPPVKYIEPSLYLVSKDPYSPENAPFKYEEFDKQRHVYPDVLWFQPYSKNPSAINFALTLGLLIESGDIDAVTIPVPNIWLSLTENNSMYLQGTIPTDYLSKFIPSIDIANRFRLCSRMLNADEDQPIGMAFRDASTVMVPRFGDEQVRADIHHIYGTVIRDNCNDPDTDFTYTA